MLEAEGHEIGENGDPSDPVWLPLKATLSKLVKVQMALLLAMTWIRVVQVPCEMRK